MYFFKYFDLDETKYGLALIRPPWRNQHFPVGGLSNNFPGSFSQLGRAPTSISNEQPGNERRDCTSRRSASHVVGTWILFVL